MAKVVIVSARNREAVSLRHRAPQSSTKSVFSLLPVHASKQGNVISLVSVYVYVCVQKKNCSLAELL